MKNLLTPGVIFLALYFPIVINAQTDIVNDAVIGGFEDDYGYDLISTADGGYFVVGNTKSSNVDIPANYGGNDAFAAKLDVDGNVTWAFNFGGTSEDFARQAAEVEDGYAIVGSSFSADTDLSGNYGSRDIWVYKLNTDGELQWQKNLGGDTVEFGTDIIATSDNGFLITGYTRSANFDVAANYGGYDIWLVKLNGDGDISWTQNYGGTNDDYATSVIEVADGYVVGGYTYSNDFDVSGNHIDSGTQADFWIYKIDFTGDIIWQKCLGGTAAEILYKIILTASGDIVATGSARSSDGDVSAHYGGSSRTDFWLVKLDADGNLLIENNFGGTNNDTPYAVTEDADGGFILTGETNSNDFDVTIHYGTTTVDIWTMKADADFNLVWQTSNGGSQDEVGRAIIALGDENYLGLGYTKSIDIDITEHLGVSGNFDAWLFWLGPDICEVSITADPVDVSVCEGGSLTLSVGASEDVTSYSWIFLSGPTVNTTVNTLTLTGVTSAYATDYFVIVSGPCGIDTSASATISITTFGTVNITPSTTQNLCDLGSVSFSTTTTGAGYAYQWYKDGAIITGATSSTYSATSVGSYKIQVSSMGGSCSGESAEVLVESDLPVITVTPAGPTNLCANGSVSLEADFDPEYTYQWYKDGFILSGATSSSYLATLVGNYVVVAGIASCTDTSVAVTVTNSTPSTIVSTTGVPDICLTGTVTINASTGTDYFYQWLEDGLPIAGATGSTLTALTVGSYAAIITNSAGCGDTSNIIEVFDSCDTSNAVSDYSPIQSITLFPNPATDQITLQYVAKENINASLTILDMAGAVVYQNNIMVIQGKNNLPVSVAQLSNGVYRVVINTNEIITQLNFIKSE